MSVLLSSVVTILVYFIIIMVSVYIICRIVTPFIKEIIYTAKEKNERNAIVEEALKGRIQYYEGMIEATQSEDLIEEYQEKILALEFELNK